MKHRTVCNIHELDSVDSTYNELDYIGFSVKSIVSFINLHNNNNTVDQMQGLGTLATWEVRNLKIFTPP